MNVTLHKYFIDDRMTILAKSKIVIFLCFYVFCGLAHFYSSFKTILSIWLTGFHLIRCSLSQNMMTRLDFDTLLLSLNHLIVIICEKKVLLDFPQKYRSMINILQNYAANLNHLMVMSKICLILSIPFKLLQ